MHDFIVHQIIHGIAAAAIRTKPPQQEHIPAPMHNNTEIKPMQIASLRLSPCSCLASRALDDQVASGVAGTSRRWASISVDLDFGRKTERERFQGSGVAPWSAESQKMMSVRKAETKSLSILLTPSAPLLHPFTCPSKSHAKPFAVLLRQCPACRSRQSALLHFRTPAQSKQCLFLGFACLPPPPPAVL